MRVLLIFMVMLYSFAVQAKGYDTLGANPKTIKIVGMYCKQEYQSEPKLISICQTTQMAALGAVESYQMKKWPNLKKDSPVHRLYIGAIKKAGVVVEGKPWVNWSLMKLYFKKDMQTWLRAQGKSDPDLDYGL